MLAKVSALAAALAISASAAFAVSTTPFDTPLSAGDGTLGNVVAASFESFNMASLSFTAADNLLAEISITINPFFVSHGGQASNSISLSYAINSGAEVPLPITSIAVPPSGSIGATGVAFTLMAGDTATFFVDGTAGQSGNQVTFAVETSPAAVPVAPAGVLLITALGALAMGRRKG